MPLRPGNRMDQMTAPRLDVAIAGEINLDLVLDGIAEVMPVERELLASAFHVTLGSSAAILAHNLASLGPKVGFVSLAARDDFGKMALDFLAQRGVDLSAMRFSDSKAGSGVSVVVNHGTVRHILTYPGTMAEFGRQHLDIDYICAARHFHLSSLFLLKGLHSGLAEFFKAVKARGLTISLDTNDDPDDRWGGVLDEILPLVDLFLPNERELLRSTGRDTLEEALAAIAEIVPLTAVKCGAKGAILQQGKRRDVIPAMNVSPVDAIGAGDSFNAGFLAAFVRGLPPERCAAIGNATGALSTLKRGGIAAFADDTLLKESLREFAPDFPALGN
jgi:sugar/nucleoside kinase (ribokinase family)